MAFLQCPVEVDELFQPRARGTRLCRLCLDALGDMFYVHSPKGVVESRQPTLP
jgi:hypothetical protein